MTHYDLAGNPLPDDEGDRRSAPPPSEAPPPSNPFGAPNQPYAGGPPQGSPGQYPPQGGWAPPPVGQSYYQSGPPTGAPVNGTLILILGILSIFVCGVVLGPIAWIMGNSALASINSGVGNPAERSNVTTGRICGIIGTVLSTLILLAYIGIILIGFQTANSRHDYRSTTGGFAPSGSSTP